METVDITGKDEIIINLDPKITLSFGEEFTFNTATNLSQSEIDTIIWTPAEFLSCNDCLKPIITPTLSGFYDVTIKDLNGCEASTTVELIVSKDYQIYIPNVFSPYREDGFNDVFFINASANIIQNIKTFRIVDRWGNLVFENKDFQANDPTQGWDGFFLGKKLNTNVFIYYAEIEFIDGETELFKGDVLILD